MSTEEMNYKKLFDCIYENKGISGIWKKVLEMLADNKLGSIEFSDSALQVLCIYFSLLDDGNTCICLDKDSPTCFYEKWSKKWNGLVIASEKKDQPNPLVKNTAEKGSDDLKSFFGTGNPLFVIDDNRLFAKKYHDAKEEIEQRLQKILSDSSNRRVWTGCKPELSPDTEKDEHQKDAVRIGMEKNLIITGGPGTGKTTVAYDILKNILLNLNKEIDQWNLFLTAPTGKAKDRLKESILKCIGRDSSFKNQEVAAKLKEAVPQTIHSLLKYSPETRDFTYNKDNRFQKNSIFIIDEASMIDICLFGSLLNAIPDSAIVFILGDKNQLPPVDAGAVLGDLIDQLGTSEHTVTLEKCHRVLPESQFISDVANRINKAETKNDVDDLLKQIKENGKGLIEIKDPDSLKTDVLIESEAISAFKKPIESAVNYSYGDAGKVFKMIETCKILCAERKGPRGVEGINKAVIKKLFSQAKSSLEYYPGELLMITKNNKLLNLSNGDNGVVVKFKGDDDGSLWFMIKQGGPDSGKERSGVFSKAGYTYYPLHQIPSDSIEPAYAITIHKSQGSGYEKVIIFLPDNEGHPLLNRQILYTAITRAEKKVLIYAFEDRIKEAVENKTDRTTGIMI